MDCLDDDFYSIIKDIIETDKYLKNKEFFQHKNTTVYDHQIKVAYECYKYLKEKNLKDDDLIIAALLHDYFLYDWHDIKKYPRKRLHGFHHPKTAANNALRDFNISKRAYKMIRTHMFPLTLFHIPTSKSAWILSKMDKRCTISERKNAKCKK